MFGERVNKRHKGTTFDLWKTTRGYRTNVWKPHNKTSNYYLRQQQAKKNPNTKQINEIQRFNFGPQTTRGSKSLQLSNVSSKSSPRNRFTLCMWLIIIYPRNRINMRVFRRLYIFCEIFHCYDNRRSKHTRHQIETTETESSHFLFVLFDKAILSYDKIC